MQIGRAPASLRWQFMAFLSACLVYLVGGYIFLRSSWQPIYALRWACLALIVLTYLLVVFGTHLKTNHRPGEETLLPSLGWGNSLTLLRGALVASLMGFLFSPRPPGWLAWLPGILYTLADAADYLDGYVARRTNYTTRLGETLDMSFDGLGVLAAATLAAQYGQVPAWYISVALARYLFLGGLWLRKRQGKPVYELAPNASRRLFAGLQMGFLAVVLWPIFTPPGTTVSAALFAIPFLAGFTRDWLTVSGALRPGKQPIHPGQRALRQWLPVTVRAAILVIHAGILLQWQRSSSQAGGMSSQLLIIETMLTLLIAAGAASRTASILGMMLLGVQQTYSGLSLAQVALLIAYTTLLFTGSGAY